MNMLTEPSTSATGKKTNNTAMVLKHGQMVPNTKEIMSLVKSMVLELSNGQINQIILVNFIIITSMAKVFTPGLMVENMKENGEQTRCTARELSSGLMEENILDNMLKIKREGTVNSFGQIVAVIEENG